jgi:hypothetical protein
MLFQLQAPQDNSLQRALFAQALIGRSFDNMADWQARQAAIEDQERERAATIELLSGRQGQIDPGVANLDIRQARGGPAFTPAQPGLVPGLTHDMAQQVHDAGLGKAVAGAAFGRMFAEPAGPNYQVQNIQRDNQNVNVLMDMNTGQIVRELGAGDRFAPPTSVKVENIMPGQLPPNPFGALGMKQLEEQSAAVAQGQQIAPLIQGARAALQAGARTGLGEESLLPVRKLAAAVGVEDPSLPATELFASLSARLTPLLRPSGTGSASDADMALFQAAVPNLSRSPQGNFALIDGFERLHQRQVQELRIREQMLDAGSFTPSAYFAELQKLGPVFDDSFREHLGGALAPAGAAEQPSTLERAYQWGTGALNSLMPGGAQAGGADIGSMSIEQMQGLALDDTALSRLTPEQRKQLAARLRAGGR